MFENLQEAIKHYAKCMKCTPSEAKADAEREIALMMEKEGYSREFAEATWMEGYCFFTYQPNILPKKYVIKHINIPFFL